MIGLMLMMLASFATLVGWLWITLAAGRESTLWGLGCFFIGPLCLAYPVIEDRFRELIFPWSLFAVGFGILFVLPMLGILS